MTSLTADSDAVGAGEASRARERIVDATLRCVSRWGMAKTTLDDVAREAGCGRATVYRLFPGGREALFEALLATETRHFFDSVVARAAGQASLEDLLVATIGDAARQLCGHAGLQFLLAYEPEAILPHLAFHKLDPVLGAVAAVLGPLLVPWLGLGDGPGGIETAARSAEWVARIVISYLTSPAPNVDLCADDSSRRMVTLFILPGLLSSGAPGPNPILAI